MNTKLFTGFICGNMVFAALTVAAQNDEPPLNRFSLNYRAGFNIHAHFKNLGSAGVPGGPSVTGLSYEDGFVRPNAEPNDLDLSWNWGYQNQSQIVGDNLVLTSSQSGKLGDADTDGPANGIELGYSRQLGRLGKTRWGIEAAVNYTEFSVNDRSTGGALTADAFSLGGETPPEAPYAGSPDGPGVLISDIPTAASVQVRSKLDSRLLGVRFGPYWEIPLCRRASISLSGGLALVWAHTDFDFQQAVAVDGTIGAQRIGATRNDDLLPGWYVGGNVTVQLSRAWSAFAGAQFQDAGNQTLRASDKQAQLNLGQSLFVSAGISFSF